MRSNHALIFLVLLSGPGAFADDAPMGRLFFTATERATLEEMRRRTQAPKTPAIEYKAGVIKPHATVRFSGIVRRSDGVSAIWVNGKQYFGNERPEDIGLLSNESNSAISVRLPESGKRVPLRVGQDMDATSGAVAERYSLREAAEPAPAPEKVTGSASRRTRLRPVLEKSVRPAQKYEDDEPGQAPSESQ